MSEFNDRIASLTPCRLAVLESRLQQKTVVNNSSNQIPPKRKNEPSPLSFAQERLWFLCQMSPKSPVYNLAFVIKFGDLSIPVLKRCIYELTQRHESLRTTIKIWNGHPFQFVSLNLNPNIPLEDLRIIPEEERLGKAYQLIEEEVSRPFDLAIGPLFRSYVLCLGDSEYWLLCTLHHVISDGWSIKILKCEINDLYTAYSNFQESPLIPLPIQYGDFAKWQRDWLQGKILEKQVTYWKHHLEGIPTLISFPCSRPRPSILAGDGANQFFYVSSKVTKILRSICRQEETTLFMILMAAFKVLMFKYTGEDDLVVGTPVANRIRPELERLVGLFVNTLIIRTQLNPHKTFLQLLGQVRETIIAAQDHQDMPFEKLVSELQPERLLSHHPLFQVMFSLQNFSVDDQGDIFNMNSIIDKKLSEQSSQVLDTIQKGTAKFDLTLVLTEGDYDICGACEYNTDIFDHSTIKRFLQHFLNILESISSGPGQPITDISMLSAQEANLIRFRWSRALTDSAGIPFTQYFYERVGKQTPLPENSRIYLLDNYENLVPVGVIGQLCIGEDSRIPMNSISQMYPTGLLGMFQEDGIVKILGPIDGFVKLRGRLFNLTQLKSDLEEIPGIEAIEIRLQLRKKGREMVMAYIAVPQVPFKTVRADVFAAINTRYPWILQHVACSFVKRLKSNTDGTLDIKALPKPKSYQHTRKNTLLPQSPVEVALLKIWREVLQVTNVSLYDNFFDLGGNSLIAFQVLSRIKESCNIEIEILKLFENPTVAQLAIYIKKEHEKQRNERSNEVNSSEFEPGFLSKDRSSQVLMSDNENIPLSYGQEQLWFLYHLQPNSPLYNVPIIIPWMKLLDVNIINQVLNHLINRHQVLRTTFAVENGQYIQKVQTPSNFKLEIIEISDRCPGGVDRVAYANEIVQAESIKPFDLENGPLFRALLLRFSPTESWLFMNMHHIVCDGWSYSILVREITSLYQSISNDEVSNLPKLTLQYSDYAIQQRKRLRGKFKSKLLSYWRKQLQGAPPLLDLPKTKQRPVQQSFKGIVQTFAFSREFSAKVLKLSKEQKVTIFMTLLTTFNILLFRNTSQHDIVIGSPVANRFRPEFEVLIGFFVNTLVFRTHLSADMTFRELLNRIKKETLQAYAHQELPIELLINELQPERSLSYHPLFQVMFAYQDTVDDYPGYMVKEDYAKDQSDEPMISFVTGTAKFDLSLSMGISENRIRGAFEYSTDLFSHELITSMIAQYMQLLKSAIDDPDSPIGTLQMLSPGIQLSLLRDGQSDDALDLTPIHRLFEQQAQANPNAVVLENRERKFTYRTFVSWSNQVMSDLHAEGIKPGDIVGVYIDHVEEHLVALLAILKIGAVYTTLNTTAPKKHLKSVNLPLVVDNTNEPGMTLEDNAILLHNIGSKANPVVLSHYVLANSIEWLRSAYALNRQDIVLQQSTSTFPLFLLETLSALSSGSRLVIVPTGQAASYQMMEKYNITIAFFYFHSFRTFLLNLPSKLPSTIRHIFCYGTEFSPSFDLPAVLLFGTRLHFLYGFSEAGLIICWADANVNVSDADSDAILKWHSIANIRACILDKQNMLVPIGVPGEFYVGSTLLKGPNTGSKQNFVRRWVTKQSEGKELHFQATGRMARFLSKGNWEFLGDMKRFVIIRGFRVNLDEVCSHLLRHPAVSDAVVTTYKGQAGATEIAAYIVFKRRQASSIDEIRASLKCQVAHYMLPFKYIELDAIPRMPDGEIQYLKLRKLEKKLPAVQREYIIPRTTHQEVLAVIWTELLKVSPISIHDNFFDLGGTSLTAMQVISRLRDIYQIDVPIFVLFERSTIEQLAEYIKECTLNRKIADMEEVIPVPPLRPIPRDQDLPLSFAQERLWFLDQFQPGTPFYNVASFIYFNETLDQESLKRVLNDCVRRHEILRTTFSFQNGRPVQIIHLPGEIQLPVDDLSSLPETERNAQLKRLSYREVWNPFDLEKGPLFRYKLIRTSVDVYLLILSMHHIVSDAWSATIFDREIADRYHALKNGSPAQLPELPIQYADFAVWQRKWLRGETLRKLVSYWKQTLEGAPPVIELPTDRPRPQYQTFNGACLSMIMPVPILNQLRELSRQEGATLFMTILTGFLVLLYRYTGQNDIVVGTPIANRSHSALENLIGFFTNTLVIRAQLEGNNSFRQTLGKVIKKTIDAQNHQDLPFEKLVEELQPERSTSYNPLFQVMFSFQNASLTEVVQAQLQANRAMAAADTPMEQEPGELEHRTAKFDLTFTAIETKYDMIFTAEYNTDLFDHATIKRMLQYLLNLFVETVRNPDEQICRLMFMDPAEVNTITNKWNQTGNMKDSSMYLHHIYQQAVEKTPHNTALLYRMQAVTYKELDDRSNQVAHFLIGAGVGPEVKVAIFLKPSIEMAITILGVLKAGGVCVPLDMKYPVNRLSYMITDSGAKILLIQPGMLGAFKSCKSWRGRMVLLNRQWEKNVSTYSTKCPRNLLNPDNSAYVIYTSGSTGKPKGIAMPHKAISNLIQWQMKASKGIALRTLQFVPLSFDVSFQELFAAWGSGGTLILIDDEQRNDPGACLRFLLDKKVERLFLPFVALDQLAHEVRISSLIPTYLTEVITAGEQLRITPEIVYWFTKMPGCRLQNQYGPSETHVVSYYTLEGPCERWPILPPIGKPIDNVSLYVLDQFLQPVPIGVAGELCVGGIALATGYLNQPDQIKTRFVPNPFRNENNARLYLTGDKARYLMDGTIEFLGRIDNQVKVRGFRLEPGEIENILCNHPQVAEAIIVVHGTTSAARRLVCYLVVKKGEKEPVNLDEYLKERLPDYMIPSRFIAIDAIPLTPSGKADRLILTKRPLPHSPNTGSETPLNPFEQRVAAIWEEILDRENIKTNDNFFDLGGHSLLATQVISRISEEFAIQLTVRTLFAAPTIKQLTIAIVQCQALGVEEVDQLLDEVEKLSEQEAQELLYTFLNNHRIVVEGNRHE